MSQPLPPISPVELRQLLDSKEPLRLIEVREPHKYVSELGHIQGAELMPLGTVQANAARLEGETRTIVSICRSGARASQSAGFWAQRGLKVRVLAGGMLAWNQAGLPISREP